MNFGKKRSAPIRISKFNLGIHYIEEKLMRMKVYEIFKILKVQKRMVSAQIILGNTVHKKIMY